MVSAMSSSEVPQLFDAVKADFALARAMRQGPATFLLDRLAEDLIERLAPVLRDFDPVLDLGTPGGAFAEALKRVRQAGSLTHLGWPHAPTVSSQNVTLPDAMLSPQMFALIVSGALLHRVNDVPGLLSQARRALKPDGLFLAAFPGGDTLHELRDCLLNAEAELTGAATMRVFPFVDVRSAGQLLQRAGFALPVADSDRITIRYASLAALLNDLRAMGQSAVAMHRSQAPGLTRAILLRTAELYAKRYADGDGRLRATIDVVWMSGWSPHESQQQPLKPGSAKTRLADALVQISRSSKASET
ncbi:BioC, biotin biosynthesis protein BioC [Rhabdaerophilaceae bacterium]